MKLSIVTPVYRPVPQFFQECAESVMANIKRLAGFHEVEWIIEGDGLLAWAPEWADVSDHPHQLGSAATRNLALDRATGDLVLTLDCDDMLLDISPLIDLFADPATGWVAGRTVVMAEAALTTKESRPPGPVPVGGVLDMWLADGAFPFYGAGPFIARRELVNEVGGWSGEFADDVNVVVGVSEIAAGQISSSIVHLHRRHDSQKTATARWAETRPARIVAIQERFLASRPPVAS